MRLVHFTWRNQHVTNNAGFKKVEYRKAPVTPGLRPGSDLLATGKCWNRGQIVERTYDWSQRSCVIARAKSVAGYDVAAAKTIWNRRHIVERTYDWSQRSWVIARGISVATRSMVMLKFCNLRFQIVCYHGSSYDRS